MTAFTQIPPKEKSNSLCKGNTSLEVPESISIPKKLKRWLKLTSGPDCESELKRQKLDLDFNEEVPTEQTQL